MNVATAGIREPSCADEFGVLVARDLEPTDGEGISDVDAMLRLLFALPWCGSSRGDPIRKLPGASTTISGQMRGQSRNMLLGRGTPVAKARETHDESSAEATHSNSSER